MPPKPAVLPITTNQKKTTWNMMKGYILLYTCQTCDEKCAHIQAGNKYLTLVQCAKHLAFITVGTVASCEQNCAMIPFHMVTFAHWAWIDMENCSSK